jgi:hypothetical protein
MHNRLLAVVDRFFHVARDPEIACVNGVGLGQTGIQLQGAQCMFAGCVPVPIVQQLDFGYGSVCFCTLAVERQGLSGILLGQSPCLFRTFVISHRARTIEIR